MDQCTVVRPDPKGTLVATTATLSCTKHLIIPCTIMYVSKHDGFYGMRNIILTLASYISICCAFPHEGTCCE